MGVQAQRDLEDLLDTMPDLLRPMLVKPSSYYFLSTVYSIIALDYLFEKTYRLEEEVGDRILFGIHAEAEIMICKQMRHIQLKLLLSVSFSC